MMMIGDPCYQAYRCLNYFQNFNNTHEEDKKHTKMLLNMPMLPVNMIKEVQLNYRP